MYYPRGVELKHVAMRQLEPVQSSISCSVGVQICRTAQGMSYIRQVSVGLKI